MANNLTETQNITKELSLLLKIISSKLVDHNQFFNIDWDEFINLAFHHRVYPVLYVKLKELDNPAVPPAVMAKLQASYFENGFNMLKLSSDLEKINRSFSDHQIDSILLKGPILASMLYGDISLRTSKDLDILVNPEHLFEAEEVLLSLGYVSNDERITKRWMLRKKHHISYYHPLTQTRIELHWQMSSRVRGISFKLLWKRRITFSLSGNPINYLSQEDLFIYLIIHGARHGWFRLRWLQDIDQMISNEMVDAEKLKLVYLEYGSEYLGGQALLLCSELYSTKVPQQLFFLINDHRSYKLANSSLFFINKKIDISTISDKNILDAHKKYNCILLSVKQKIWFALDSIYPSYKDYLMLPLPQKLHFLYYPLRPLLWFWRRMKREVI
ncbi:nucleotidyltransferase domain-containing protein [Paenibacillus protaetiae]|uniref:Renal dipeptidase n=1 Tax=Paenibacillus protaetiae TaxID=2509456 RepID=A0A4P6F8I6_9BACL|nr:nucleotidyltransferase family protein [Paenibacillus protaetiae]QAY66758.1 Renal dipeptidase [Paenibacillus protaetiae]